MKARLFLVTCALLWLTGCGAPAEPEFVSAEDTTEATTETAEATTEAMTEATTEATTETTEPVTTRPTEPITEANTEPPTEPPTEPATEAATTDPAVRAVEIQTFDSANHPILGHMGMTNMEREYTMAIDRRDIDMMGKLMDDPRYPDICGGFSYRGGTMYVYALDIYAIEDLIHDTLAGEDIPYVIEKTPYSLRLLVELYDQIEADREKYGVMETLYRPRYNQVAVRPKDPENVDPDLERLAEENGCVEILREPGYPVPEMVDSVLLSALEFDHPDIYAGVRSWDADGNGYDLLVTDVERAREIIDGDPELRLAYILLKDRIKFTEVEYSKQTLDAAQLAVMDALEPLLEKGTTTWWLDATTLRVEGKGLDDPAVQKAAKDAAMAAVQKATGQSGESIKFAFINDMLYTPPRNTGGEASDTTDTAG